MVRLGLKTLLETVERFRVVGEAATAAEALVQARQHRPDVVLMDVRLPDGSGIDACREIRSERPETRVIVLTSYSEQEAVVNSIVAGAAGYLLKESDTEQLIQAIEVVGRGGSLIDPAIHQTVLTWMQGVGANGE